jgi:uncharacterized membrane protein
MPRHKSLLTVIRDLVQQEVRSAIQSLLGSVSGAAAGGLTGALVGLGIPEYEAKQYESKLKEGNLLISVHTDDRDERSRAKETFKQNHAEDISTTGEARAS